MITETQDDYVANAIGRFMEIDRAAAADDLALHYVPDISPVARYVREEYERPEAEVQAERDAELARLKLKIARITALHNETAISPLNLTSTRRRAINPGDEGYEDAPARFDPRAYQGEAAWVHTEDLRPFTHSNLDEAYDRLVREDAATTQGTSPWLDLIPPNYPSGVGDTVRGLGFTTYGNPQSFDDPHGVYATPTNETNDR